MTNERKLYIANMIWHYMSNGMSLQDLIETTNITKNECLSVLNEIIELFKKDLRV